VEFARKKKRDALAPRLLHKHPLLMYKYTERCCQTATVQRLWNCPAVDGNFEHPTALNGFRAIMLLV
jgi:hypothetical protein